MAGRRLTGANRTAAFGVFIAVAGLNCGVENLFGGHCADAHSGLRRIGFDALA